MFNTFAEWMENPEVRRIRNRVAAATLVVALLFFALSSRFESREALVSFPGSEWRDRQFSKLWVDSNGGITGTNFEYNRLVLERREPGSRWRRLEVAIVRPGVSAEDGIWALDASATRLAWADENRAYVAELDFDRKAVEAQNSIALPKVRYLIFSAPTRIQAVVSGSAVKIWDTEAQLIRAEPRIDLEGAEQIAGDGEYLAGASRSTQSMILYRMVSGVPRLIEKQDAPPAQFRLVMPAPGQMAALWTGGIWTTSRKVNTPGPVASLAWGPSNAMIAAGGFDGVVHCEADGMRLIADVKGVRAVAANDRFLAISGSSGTELRTFGYETVYTTLGKGELWIAGLSMAICSILAGMGMLVRVLMLLATSKAQTFRPRPGRFTFSADLVDAFRNGRVILWAGSGLSAQTNVPTRQAYLNQMIETAVSENWIDASFGDEMRIELRKGNGEECIAPIAEYMEDGCRELEAFCRMMYRRIIMLQPAQVSLSRLPFNGAITTNYDAVLERMGPGWQTPVIIPPNHPLPNLCADQFFLWKLYGDVQSNDRLILSRPDLKKVLAQCAARPDIVERLFKHRTLFIIGCSMEGLTADLAMLGVTPYPDVKHFAFATASARNWEKQAAYLKETFGVEVSACDPRTVAQALPELLSELATAVEGSSHSYRSAAGD